MLRLDGLTLAYGDTVVVSELSLEVRTGEVLCVLGPSGCGKSTLLRAIAGLEQPVRGRILLDGRDVSGVRPDRRGVGLMFQEHALFPHRSVHDNVGFGPRMQGMAPAEIRRRVQGSLELVGLTGLGDRRVTELSGGERQRVALARAIAPRPRLLMLDEPLGSLDRPLQARLLEELPELFEQLGTTVIYVTHDQQEATAVADRIAVMRSGRIEQIDVPDALWRAPRNAFVARFLGLRHVLDVHLEEGRAMTPWGPVTIAGATPGDAQLLLLSDALRLLTVHTTRLPGELQIAGTVHARRSAGEQPRVTVQTDAGPRLSLTVPRREVPVPGSRVVLGLDPTAVHLLEHPGP